MAIEDCVIGQALKDLRNLLYMYADEPKVTLLQKVKGYPGRYYPADWIWLTMCDVKTIFYKRLLRITMQVTQDSYKVLLDLVKFQREMMLDPSYDPERGKVFQTYYNWDQYLYYRSGRQIHLG
jgi:hypothetical protein